MTASHVALTLASRIAKAPAIAAAEVRGKSFSYRAELTGVWAGTYGGAARRARYYRYDGGWKEIPWSHVPKNDYRRLRKALTADLARGEMS